jgi:hypothetical protein
LGLDPKLVGIFLDLQHFTAILNGVGEMNKVDPLDYSQHAQHLLYRLLFFSSLQESGQLPQMEAILHMTLVAFCVTLLPEHGGLHKRFDLLSRNIQSALESVTVSDPCVSDFRLWILFISGISVTDSSDDHWLLPALATTLHQLALESWAKVVERLSAYMWIGALHDFSGTKLFELASKCKSGNS